MQDIPDLTSQASKTAADVLSRKLPESKIVNVVIISLILFIAISITVLQQDTITNRHLGLFGFIFIVLAGGLAITTYLISDKDQSSESTSSEDEDDENEEGQQ